jgi:hypothetical protein
MLPRDRISSIDTYCKTPIVLPTATRIHPDPRLRAYGYEEAKGCAIAESLEGAIPN